MALTQVQTDKLVAAVQRMWSRGGAVCTFDKPALRGAVTATDAWLDANKAELNAALPAAFRTAASTEQKGLLLALVTLVMAGIDPREV